jgi:Raf kinase inhibitor-like YbhB/YbcL family protein
VKKILVVIGIIIVSIILLYIKRANSNNENYDVPVNLKVTSTSFENDGDIPIKYTGKGEDISPSLKLDTIAAGAKTIAIIMDDLDHPLGTYNHWVIWNIPASFDNIPEGVPKEEVVNSLGEAIQGKSGYGGKHWYRGPLPPFGTHKYIFKVYVLDTTLKLENNAGKSELLKAMKEHILQYGALTGKFSG